LFQADVAQLARAADL